MKTVEEIKHMKGKQKIAVLTCYSYWMASIMQETNLDMLLVGDSLGMVEFGFKSTREVKVDYMLRSIEAVKRGAKDFHIIGDMPYNSYRTPEEALKNASLMIEAGANSVKIEGANKEIINTLVKNGIPVVGHIGVLPQYDTTFKIKGKDSDTRKKLLLDAQIVEEAGAFCIVLENIVHSVAKEITSQLSIPTIGIGAGPFCDGQVLVVHDVLGLFKDFKPPFAKRYVEGAEILLKAFNQYVREVKENIFPSEEYYR